MEQKICKDTISIERIRQIWNEEWKKECNRKYKDTSNQNKIKLNNRSIMWHSIAFGLSLILPSNGIFLSLWHGCFGRFYIAYWLVVYHEMWMPFFKNLLNT